MNLRLTAVGALLQWETPSSRGPAAGSPTRGPGSGACTFRGAGFVATPGYAQDALAPGMTSEGPAIIEQPDATSLVAPEFRARVDAAHNILLQEMSADTPTPFSGRIEAA